MSKICDYAARSFKYCVFPENFVFVLNSDSSAAALVFYLPGVCTQRGKTKKGKSPEYFIIFEKNTIFNEHPVYDIMMKKTRDG